MTPIEIQKAIELTYNHSFEPNHDAYFPRVDGEDIGGYYCEKCIDSVIENLKTENEEVEKEECDPDFCGGETRPKTCEECGYYFYTDFIPDLEMCEEMESDYLENPKDDSLVWKLNTSFRNFEHLNENLERREKECEIILIRIAEKIIQE